MPDTPWKDTFYEILKELYSSDEAEVVVRMPSLFSDLDRISRTTGIEKEKLVNFQAGGIRSG